MSHFFKPLVKHSHIREILYREIALNGAIGNLLPTENALAQSYGVSRETVRLALKSLENEGLIERRRGKGTFIAALPDPRERNRLTGEIPDTPDHTVSVVIERKIAFAPAEARWLGKRIEDVLWVRRLRLFDGLPLAVHDAYLPRELGPMLDSVDLTLSSMRAELERALGQSFDEAERQIDAIAADRTIAGLLEIPIGKPTLLLKRYYLKASEPIVVFNSYYRTDRYYYSVKPGNGDPMSSR